MRSKLLVLVVFFAVLTRTGAQTVTLSYDCPDANKGDYWSCLPTVNGLTPPMKFTVSSGELPEWLTLNPETGELKCLAPFSFSLHQGPNAPADLRGIVAELQRLSRASKPSRPTPKAGRRIKA